MEEIMPPKEKARELYKKIGDAIYYPKLSCRISNHMVETNIKESIYVFIATMINEFKGLEVQDKGLINYWTNVQKEIKNI